MKLKIFSIPSDSISLIEDTVNAWLANQELQSATIQNITEYTGTKVGTKIYLLYEEVLQEQEQE